MKISVITITCRTNGRLSEMARCLNATFSKHLELELEWLVVDELFDLRKDDFAVAIDERHQVLHFPPPVTKHRASSDKAVAHNTARNAGLVDATGDYVIFLNDCNMVTADWAGVAADACAKGVAWKCKMQILVDMKIPDDGLIRKPGHHDLMRPVPILTGASASWGAPREAFEKIRGFDLSYDGERYGNDLDAIVRLSRIGIQFVTTARAFVIQLRRTKIDKEITTRKDVYAGVRNKKLFARLQKETDRYLPLWAAGDPEPIAQIVATTPTVQAAPRVVPPPRARFVQCPPAPKNAGAAYTPGNPRPVPARAPKKPAPAIVPPASELDVDVAALDTNGAGEFDGDIDGLLD